MQIGLQKRISFALTTVIVLFVAAQGYLAYTSLEQQEDSLGLIIRLDGDSALAFTLPQRD